MRKPRFYKASPMTSGRTRAQPPMVADELRRQTDIFTDLVELRTKVGRDPSSGQRDASANEVRGSHSPIARPPHDPAGTTMNSMPDVALQ
jgi:hypothetical protein